MRDLHFSILLQYFGMSFKRISSELEIVGWVHSLTRIVLVEARDIQNKWLWSSAINDTSYDNRKSRVAKSHLSPPRGATW